MLTSCPEHEVEEVATVATNRCLGKSANLGKLHDIYGLCVGLGSNLVPTSGGGSSVCHLTSPNPLKITSKDPNFSGFEHGNAHDNSSPIPVTSSLLIYIGGSNDDKQRASWRRHSPRSSRQPQILPGLPRELLSWSK